jgi:hypothetical protein
MATFSHATLKRNPFRTQPEFDFAFSNATRVSKIYHFNYYLPHISDSTTDFYTDVDWVAYDLTEPNEQAETEALWLDMDSTSEGAVDLPFIAEDDFNYYPSPAELPYHSSDEDWLINTEGRSQEPRKTKLRKKKEGEGFWLERKVMRLVGVFERLSLRSKSHFKRHWRFRS